MAAVDRSVAMAQEGTSEDTPVLDQARTVFAVQWVHAGCVTLLTSHKFAAALAASRMREADLLEDLILPAKAFRVEIPNGILHSDEHNLDYTQINVCVLDDGRGLVMLEGEGPVGREGTRRVAILPNFFTPGPGFGGALAELLADREDDEEEMVITQMASNQQSPDELEVRRRMMILARRIVAGLLLTFAHTTNWQERTSRNKAGKRDPRDPPKHRNIFIGRPLQVDARPALASYLGAKHRHAPPSMQTLVRGHHKRQVIGVARSGRKVIWIEPYWRGPEDAPILARPYVVGPT